VGHQQPGNRPTGVRHRRQSLDGHGFNGFHVPVFCRWLDIHKEANPEFDNPDPTPDPSTLEALEVLIQKTYAAGGMVHLWQWGDNNVRILRW